MDPTTTSKKTLAKSGDAATANRPEVTLRQENKKEDAKESAKKVNA